ncbi:MAG TPA: choline/carnitine O-acyltransferase [Pseudonocardia sp.]|jgi:carnitine O-acetyltransferase|uniref:choline/carnitine O-acyltransferase n=1 Tax=Pseudonocardia sp. TaxID=60912 RepID=UPI002F410C1C
MTSDGDYSTRTFGHEHLLPRVPLPELKDSCARFLDWCTPLLTGEQLDRTRASVEEFLAPDSSAWLLQDALRGYDNEPGVHSWLDAFWPYRYLGRRDRIALNANFFFLLRDTSGQDIPVDGEGPQLSRAANLVSAALRLKRQLDSESVPPVFLRGQPQSMEQYKYLFSTTRIPGEELDTVRSPYRGDWPGPSPARHIVVFAGGRMARVEVCDAAGRPYPMAELAATLRAVRESARQSVRGPGGAPRPFDAVGHLTTMARADWARARQALREHSPVNAEALETVETALLCLCLDSAEVSDDQAACDQLLHGDSGNRWFDKALSIVVFPDGRAGLNIEHCELDGTTILSFTDSILTPREAEQGPLASGRPPFQPLEFLLDEELRSTVREAAQDFAAFADNTATKALSFTDLGTDRVKKLGMSPDSFVQMAYQLAHQRAKGLIGATYESIATRQFRLGRTEAMRVVTPEVLRFVAAMQDADTEPAARAEAFRAAAEAHVARAKDCQQGRAPEQHLWELQLIARRRGSELGATEPLALYDSPGWTVMREDYLSTSSAPSVNIDYFGFGSTSSRCIGVAYVLLPDRLNIYLSTRRDVAEAMTAFGTELRRAVDELTALLDGTAASS